MALRFLKILSVTFALEISYAVSLTNPSQKSTSHSCSVDEEMRQVFPVGGLTIAESDVAAVGLALERLGIERSVTLKAYSLNSESGTYDFRTVF